MKIHKLNRLISLFVLLGILIATTYHASAHANLVRSDPPANAVLTQAPQRIQLWFSEAVEAQFSEIQVNDLRGGRLDKEDMQVAPGDPLSLIIGVNPLPNGVYTVVYKTTSAVDGHTVKSAFAFGVGVTQAAVLTSDIPEPTGERINASSVISRWLNYIGGAMTAGATPFLALVLLPALAALGASGTRKPGTADSPSRPAGAFRLTLRFLQVTCILLVVGTFLALVVQAVSAADVPLQQAFSAPLAAVITTRYGFVLVQRFVLVLIFSAIVLIWSRKPADFLPSRDHLLAMAALAAGILLTTSLNSHAAAQSQNTAVAIIGDWLHLLASGLWVGGLPLLGISLVRFLPTLNGRERVRLLARLIPSFSTLAIASVLVLVTTGLYQSLLQIASWEALTDTVYGQALIVKLALFVALLVMGAVNLLIVSPELSKLERIAANDAQVNIDSLSRSLRTTVSLEVVFAVGVLLAASVMTSIQPAKDALVAERASGQRFQAKADDLNLSIRVSPGIVGLNTYDIAVTDNLGRPVSNLERVAARFTMLSMDMGEQEAVAQSRGDGHYTLSGGYLLMVGRWQMDISIRRAGKDDAVSRIVITALDRPGQATLGTYNPIPMLILGVLVFLAGATILGGSRRLRSISTGWERGGYAGGSATLVAGLALGLYAILNPASVQASNPIPADANSLAIGQEIFQSNCIPCHGPGGRGDGPAARTLNPRPPALGPHMVTGVHTDAQIFDWVSNGVEGTAMPAWKESLTAEQRWHVINYVRTFANRVVRPTPGQ